MTVDDKPVQHYLLDEPADLRTVLERAGVEYLDIDTDRTIVIYQQAILMLVVTEGQATAAREFDVEFWKESPDDFNHDPEELLTTFINELFTTGDVARH